MKNLKWSKGQGLVVFGTDFRGSRSMNNFNQSNEVDDEQETFENCVFKDSLTYTGYESGRSRVNLVFHSAKFDARVYMFVSDFNDMMLDPDAEITDGGIDDMFTFVKRGANYGIKRVSKNDE